MTREEFKASRKRLKLTQSELGDELGISSRTVQSYEYGKNKIPLAIESLLKKKISETFPEEEDYQVIEMNVANLESLSIEKMVTFCMKHRNYFEELPEIKLLIEKHRKDAEASLLKRHIFLKNYESDHQN